MFWPIFEEQRQNNFISTFFFRNQLFLEIINHVATVYMCQSMIINSGSWSFWLKQKLPSWSASWPEMAPKQRGSSRSTLRPRYIWVPKFGSVPEESEQDQNPTQTWADPWLTDGPTQSWADSCPWPDSSDYPSQENNQAGSSQDAPGTEAPPWSGPGPEPSKSNHNDSVSMFQCFMFLPKPPGVQLGGHKCRFKAVARGVGLWQGLSSTRRGPNGFSSHRFHFSFSDPKAAENGLQPLFSFNVSCDEWLFIIKVL